VVTIGAFRLSRFRIRSGCGGSARPLARRGRRWPAAWRTLARSAARAGLRCGGPPCPAAPGGRRRPLSAAGCRRRGFRWPGRRRAWRRRAWRPVANGTARPPRIGPASDMGRPAYGAAIKQRPHVPTDSYAAARNGSAALSVKGRFRQPWWYMLAPVDRPVVPTWTTGTFAAAAGIAEPTRADPATPSARIAGMIKARPMRMIPPPQLPGLAGCGRPGLAGP